MTTPPNEVDKKQVVINSLKREVDRLRGQVLAVGLAQHLKLDTFNVIA